jgi:hypothetical protein
MVPHISAVHSLPYFPLPSVNPNIKYFFMESKLCIICQKYFNLLIVAEASRKCLGIIWLVTDAFILLTVRSIINLSFFCFPLHLYYTAGRTVVYSSLTFVFVESSMIFGKFAVAALLKLILYFISPLLITTRNMQLVTVLIFSSYEKKLTFSTVLNTVVFFRYKLGPILSVLFFTHVISSIMSSLFSASRVVPSMYVIVIMFHVNFPIPTSILPTPPVFIMYLLYGLNRPGIKLQPCLTFFWIQIHSVVTWSTYTLASYSCIGLVVTLSVAWVFPNFLHCSTFLIAASYHKPLCNL